jgi:amino acid transporter
MPKLSMKFKGELLRWALLLMGAFFGLIFGFAHGYLFYWLKGPFKKDSFEEHSMVLTGCITFIVIIYNTGIFGYKFLGKKEEFEELKRNKKWHLFLINIFSLLYIIGAWFWPSK